MFDYQYGTSGDDNLTGGAGEDVFFAYEGNDIIVDTNASSIDYVYAGEGNDWIFTGGGDDYAYGNAGNDTILGDRGSDILAGDEGDDLLIGAYFIRSNPDPGVDDIDTLSGGSGSDTFVLGEKGGPFYDSSGLPVPFGPDYAIIKDFDPDSDKIQLHGSSSEYVVGSGLGGSDVPDIDGMYLFYEPTTETFPELIGILEDVSFSDVNLTNPDQFTYVA